MGGRRGEMLEAAEATRTSERLGGDDDGRQLEGEAGEASCGSRRDHTRPQQKASRRVNLEASGGEATCPGRLGGAVGAARQGRLGGKRSSKRRRVEEADHGSSGEKRRRSGAAGLEATSDPSRGWSTVYL